MAKTEILSEGAHRFDSTTFMDLNAISFRKCYKESQARQDPQLYVNGQKTQPSCFVRALFIPMRNMSPLKVTKFPFLDYACSLLNS